MELKEGEQICTECNGTGEKSLGSWKDKSGRLSVIMTSCKKCLGHGKLDWIEEVVGKNGRYPRTPYIIKEGKCDD
jgi:hypothetical protein